MSDRGLSIFDDDPEDDLPEETGIEDTADVERTQVLPTTPTSQPLPQRRPVMPPIAGPGEATREQPTQPPVRQPLSGEPVVERPAPQTPPPAPAGTVAEAAQVYARQTSQPVPPTARARPRAAASG